VTYNDQAKTNPNPIGVIISANPISGAGPLKVDFESLVSGCQNCKYEWNFSDGSKSNEKNPTHIFTKP
jgi:PKD repeat protein